ncbi:hypothetical protein [Paenibacillus arenilitoris]|uniref:Uncharacterized protein n=1 Tax=Paenibacillus arenilitoris TaxID=2772299 RepID=A0A927H6A4_9BACL|nr:hypothetical protein [Paenibacillus arenilitoris]MBD2869780.1 hypothetical protein [Paenibacillus arenilitoris]
MAGNRMDKAEDHRMHTSLREHTATLKTEKFAKRPPSLNRINKQLP